MKTVGHVASGTLFDQARNLHVQKSPEELIRSSLSAKSGAEAAMYMASSVLSAERELRTELTMAKADAFEELRDEKGYFKSLRNHFEEDIAKKDVQIQQLLAENEARKAENQALWAEIEALKAAVSALQVQRLSLVTHVPVIIADGVTH